MNNETLEWRRRALVAEDTIAKKDARIAELERMSTLDEERIEQAKKNRGEALMRAKAAESALATLRQAVSDVADDLDGAVAYKTPEWVSRKCVGSASDKLRAALSSTPSEHPDTATLRGVYERLDAWYDGRVPAEVLRSEKAAWRYIRGDSGPGGGGS